MPKNSKEKLVSLQAARTTWGKDAPITLGKYHRIRPSTIIKIAQRWRERMGHSVRSYDKPIKYSSANAREIAVRLAVGELMQPLKKFNLKEADWLTLEKILQHRPQSVKHSDVPVRLDQEILFLKIINSLGEQKTMHYLNLISNRAIQIQKVANSEKIQSKSESDAFSNIGPNIHAITTKLGWDLEDKPDFVKRIEDILHQKDKQLTEVQKIKNKIKRDHLTKLLTNQLEEGTLELTKFKIHHRIF